MYLSAVNKCYPGRAPKGGGDRAPSPLERALCRPFLLRELVVVQPKLVILVGSTAIKEIYGDKIRLEEIIGKPSLLSAGELYDRLEMRLIRAKQLPPVGVKSQFDAQAPVEIHQLPHPSGASTWLNLPENKARLLFALDQLGEGLRTED